MTTLTIPPIYTPFPPSIHPSHEAIDTHTRAWAEELRIGSPDLRARLVQQVDDGYCEEAPLATTPQSLWVESRTLH